MNERQMKIFEILSKSPAVSVKELSIQLNVSEVTIRKDLSSLENEGLLKRTHGGAVQMSSDSIEKRIMFKYEEKLKIAKQAAKLVKEGETVLIEAGSTNALLAKELSNKDRVHIITNSLYIANTLKSNRNVKVTLLGGELQEEAETMVGPLTKLCLSMLAVNKAFIGMDGFSEKLGFTCGDFLRAEVAKEMCYRAENIIILAEASKFNNVGMTSVVDLSKVSIVITNDGIDESKTNILEKNNIKTIIV
ncbi:DeoR/GlpR family DNA-binding transcription regulator [Clostridium sp. C8-1-8]|uniref:DeoR/GlpR family DNA-binding transcription regulator n=1 Tax=Clostridium sp. C8-1-8 TaxID=2698831 RepID=UPI00136A9863|nr:DeoR/GlpR family DNA-binding transcription regulator [Clostridium sp. C8-1-8]